MEDWWTYSLSDFLMFAPRTYYRMLERHNEAVWPGQIISVGMGLGILALLPRPSLRRGAIIAVAMGILWAWIAWSFLWTRYAGISWAMKYIVPLFVVESLLLLWTGIVRRQLSFQLRSDIRGVLGVGLFALAVILYPIMAAIFGRPLQQAEVFGIAPDPTVIATLGLLLLADGGRPWPLLVIPTLWCLITGATLWALQSPETFVTLGAAILGVAAAGSRRSLEPARERAKQG